MSDLFAIEVSVSLEGSSRASEGEHWEWHGYGHIDAHLTHIDLALEFPGSGSRCGEDGSPVTIGIGVDDVDSLIMKVWH